MPSNASNSNPNNSPKNTSDTHTTNIDTPNDVRVVSQSQDEGNNIVLSHTLQTPANLHILLSTVCNDVLTGNSPLVAPASIAKEPPPIIDSPTKLQIDVPLIEFYLLANIARRRGRLERWLGKWTRRWETSFRMCRSICFGTLETRRLRNVALICLTNFSILLQKGRHLCSIHFPQGETKPESMHIIQIS